MTLGPTMVASSLHAQFLRKLTFLVAGEIQLWIDGASVINVGGLNLRLSNEGQIEGMHFSTFFGGKLSSSAQI